MRNLRTNRIGLATALLLFCLHAVAQRVHYTVSPVFENDELKALSIGLLFRTEDTTNTALLLPNSWGGQEELWKGIADLKVAGGRLQSSPDPQRKSISHEPHAELIVTYRVIQDWKGEPRPFPTGNPYRPIIQATYFHVIGNTIFVAGDWDDSTHSRPVCAMA